MIKQLAAAIASVVLFLGPKEHVKAPAVRYPSPGVAHEVIKQAKMWTVLISGESWEGWDRGTGVLLDSTHVLTCYHVANAEVDSLWVFFYPGYFVVRGKMVAYNVKNDLAILELDTPAWAQQYAKFTTEHSDGEPITVIGNAEGSMQWFVTYGIISGENHRDLFTDGQVYNGDSGGPWINSKGEVVAITDWGREFGKEFVNGGIATHTVNDFLKDCKSILEKKKK